MIRVTCNAAVRQCSAAQTCADVRVQCRAAVRIDWAGDYRGMLMRPALEASTLDAEASASTERNALLSI